MAHFAQLDANNKVVNVTVINNSDIIDENGNENEQMGIELCKKIYPRAVKFVQCSYNGNFRKNHASIGGTYDEQRDAFIFIKPYPSWILNETTCRWEPPVAYKWNGEDGKHYSWDEDIGNWVEIPQVQYV
jgi:hypothetical protein